MLFKIVKKILPLEETFFKISVILTKNGCLQHVNLPMIWCSLCEGMGMKPIVILSVGGCKIRNIPVHWIMAVIWGSVRLKTHIIILIRCCKRSITHPSCQNTGFMGPYIAKIKRTNTIFERSVLISHDYILVSFHFISRPIWLMRKAIKILDTEDCSQ